MYNRLIERGRSTQILGPSNINSKTAEHHANEKKCLQYLNDLLVVSKIPEPENITNEKIDEDVLAAMNSLIEEELAEQNQISKENDEIVKKQYQILQADERGRLAINAEIAEIRKRQDDKLRALQARRHALEIEKARAKQIASKPPPLPKSVKLLLRDERNKLLDPPKNPTNEVIPNDPDDEIVNSSDKENVVLSEEERKAAEKLKEERNMKAQKRFNEALKKDREKK
ncbi:titin homolog, partial [Uloborus diversus]|uniref:titin homolog n=1 Tax=Uloborus diversus TaxID=327109 RepID=UPI002408FC56